MLKSKEESKINIKARGQSLWIIFEMHPMLCDPGTILYSKQNLMPSMYLANARAYANKQMSKGHKQG